MNIATALNKKYLPYTTVMLRSLCENNSCHIDAYIFHSELDDLDLELMRASLESYDIKIISVYVDRNRFNDRMPRNDQWSIEAYYRLLMFDVLKQPLDRILYLDGDIVVINDIGELYNADFSDKYIIGCFDKSGLNAPENYGEKHNEMFREAYEHGYRYINSGVLLINFEELRKEFCFQNYLDAMEEWNYEMEAPDQDIINWVHWKKIGYADYVKYNMFARIAHNREVSLDDIKRDTTIVHFAGYKPWESANFHYDIEKLWWDYAKHTPFYDRLLEDFIESSCCDNTVKDYLAALEFQLAEKKELLRKSMETLEQLY